MYKPVELPSLEDDNMPDKPDKKSIPFSRQIGNCRLSGTGKTLRIHFFETNRFFVLSVDDVKHAIENPTEVIPVKEYEQNNKEE